MVDIQIPGESLSAAEHEPGASPKYIVPTVTVRGDQHAELRRGRVTGSVIKTIMRGGHRAKNTLLKNFGEPVTFYRPEDTPNMPAQLKWGHLYEPRVRGHFWTQHPEYAVERPAFVRPGEAPYGTTEDLPWQILDHVGVSPDGILIHDDGIVTGIEIKVPYKQEIARHYMESDGWWDKHIDQVDLQMLATGAPYWWFACSDPREPETSPYYYYETRVERDQDRIDAMRFKICEFVEMWCSGATFGDPAMSDRVDMLDGLL